MSFLVRVLSWFPAIYIAAATLVFAIIWGKGPLSGSDDAGVLKKFRRVVLFAIIGAFLATLGREIATPLAGQWFSSAKNAEMRSKQAQEMAALAQQAEENRERKILGAGVPGEPLLSDAPEQVRELADSIALVELVQTATRSYSTGDWINAHYNAETVGLVSGGRPTEQVSQETLDNMVRISADSWQRLSMTGQYVDEAAREYFLKKRGGYAALMTGQLLVAYRTFKELHALHNGDNDVAHFFTLAQQRVRARYFFMDETERLESLKKIRDVYFLVKQGTVGTYVLFMRQVTPVKDSNHIVFFIKDLAISLFNAAGTFVYSLNVSDAKLITVPSGDFDVESKELRGITAVGDIPLVQFDGVNRDTGYVMSRPVYIMGENREPELADHLYLNVPRKDLLEIFDLFNETGHFIPSLFTFSSKAEEYGFSSSAVRQLVLQQLTYPFVFILLFFLFSAFAWNYRMDKYYGFSVGQIFVFGILTILIYGVLQFALFGIKLLNYALITLLGSAALPVIVLGLVLMLAFTSIWFCLTIRGEQK
jgi:hypothetical protein